MELICTKELEGFTEGKLYRLMGCGGEYVQLQDDKGEIVIVLESYFMSS